MRILFLISIICLFCFSCNTYTAQIRYDGIYKETKESTNIESAHIYLRFYPNGVVVTSTSIGSPEDVFKWLNPNMQDLGIGKYSVKGNKLSFSTSSQQGKILFEGSLQKGNEIALKETSLINGYQAHLRFHFIDSSMIGERLILNEDSIFTFEVLDKKPKFLSNNGMFSDYLNANLKNYAVKDKSNKTIVVQFVIEKNGEVTNSKILSGLNKIDNKQVLLIINKSPKWIPGEIKNKAVRSYFVLPIEFKK